MSELPNEGAYRARTRMDNVEVYLGKFATKERADEVVREFRIANRLPLTRSEVSREAWAARRFR